MTREITNVDDVIDSRDVIERIEELRSQLAADAEGEELLSVDTHERDLLREEVSAELAKLEALAEEGEREAEDWEYGATLIHDAHFEEYARDLAEDVGAFDRNASWPLTYIDWEAAAAALQQDYTDIDFAGQTYWVR